MRLATTLLLLCIIPAAAAGAISTTQDGSFQAIAQGPDTISVYWRHEGRSVQLYQDGKLLGTYPPNTSSTFACHTISSLRPNTWYSFSLDGSDQAIRERTWCEVPAQANVDLLIIGGSASGVSAAVTAARLGMSVALVEDTNRLGGMASNGLGSTDLRDKARSNGFFEDFRQRVVRHYGTGDGLRYEPKAANAIFKEMVYEQAPISVFMKCEADRPIMSGKTVTGAVIRDLVSGKTGRITARITIDATHTGDFAAACGCEFRIGREARSDTEPHAGVIYFNNATQEILPGSTGEADCKQQSYAYLMIWRDYGEAGAPLVEQPRFYSPDTYRYSPEWTKTWNYTSGRLPNGKFEINQHPFGIDWPGINHDYPIAGKARRAEIESMYKDRALGYLYYFQNELGHKNLGLADDEFVDNGNFPVTLYVREARRIVGEHMFTEADVTNARDFHRADSIAIGDYPMDSHAMEDLKDPTRIDKGEGEEWLRKFTPWYQVPYGVLVPKRIDGLLVSTAASGTHIGYGTLRMEPVRMSLGQAAAAAAYWSILYTKSARQINPAWIQDKILSQYAYINWNSDVDRDTRHFKAINFLGARGVFVNEAFETDTPVTREEALVLLNRLLLLEGCPRGMEKSPLPDPQAPVTRADFAQWLVEAKQKSPDRWQLTVPIRPSYSDVSPDSPYYAAVETLKAHRISALLFEDPEINKFKPEEPINRADAAQALYLAHRAYAMNYWLP